ncbi:hypothetical protein Fmac_022405 [Flemingia macrophylla]|uniref:DUF4408 domain-containing protein n=1 Tax=Flemingia macrophylla TaxID=520843 RepID=A0ABD1LZL2_9FABA
MDSFNLQAEKANAILKHRKLRRLATLLRILEVCAVVVLASRLSLHLPDAVRNSSQYLRDLSLFMNNPRFVFLVGNIIIIALFAQFSATNVGQQNLYQEFAPGRPETVFVATKPRVRAGEKKVYRRCETEVVREKRRRVLRRCETKRIKAEEEMAPEDGMSNEEFRRTVEAFIARQQRIRREEENYNYHYLM